MRFIFVAICILSIGCERSAPSPSQATVKTGGNQPQVKVPDHNEFADTSLTKGSGAEHTQKSMSEPSATKAVFYTVDHYDSARNPMTDLAATITRAKAEKKNILVQVGGDWCGWCHLMSTFIETNEKVRDTILANYLVMKVTENADNKNAAFLSQYPSIPGYPHLFVLDTNGKLLHSQGTAELEQGQGYNETAYLEFLNKWKPVR
jgi:thiol-disulfide isomerase/thioredoxin